MSFTGFAFYIAVRCGFDKHLYLTIAQTQVLAANAIKKTIIIDYNS